MGHWPRSRRRATRQRGATVASWSSPASRESARPRSSPGSSRDLEAGARVLLGTCDDLSIPRPLGAIQDLVGSVSRDARGGALGRRRPARDPAAADRRAGAAAAADGARARGRALGGRCDARHDHGARRGGSARCPALLVLTFRDGEAPPGHPLHAASARSVPATRSFLELAPLSRGRGRLARRRRRGRRVRRDRRQPVLRHRAAGLAHRRRAAALDRERGAGTRLAARRRGAAPRRARLRRAEPRAHVGARRGDARLAGGGGGTGAPAAARGRPDGTCASATSWPATRSGRASRSPRGGGCTREILAALLAADADPADIVHHAEAAGAEDVVADYALVAARRAAALDSNREAYSHYRRAAGLRRPAPAARAGGGARGAGDAPPTPSTGSTTPSPRSSARSRSLPRAGRRRGRRAAARASSRASTGSPATATRARAKALEAIAILEPLGESVELARAYSGLSQLAMLAEDTEPGARLGRAGARARDRLGDERTRAHALVNIGSAEVRRRSRETRRCSRRTPSPTRPATGTRRRARSSTSATR